MSAGCAESGAALSLWLGGKGVYARNRGGWTPRRHQNQTCGRTSAVRYSRRSERSMPPPAPVEIPPLREAFQQFMRLLRVIRPYWGPLAKGMVLGLVLGLFGMVLPYLSKL